MYWTVLYKIQFQRVWYAVVVTLVIFAGYIEVISKTLKTLKTVWKQKLRREDLPVDENITECNKHFKQEFFDRNL